ncbi:ferric reductase-like transmembrane domain-containing protein [Pseudomonas nicosulfuronedens]|uniref:Ferric reductase like transmembrane component n=1 Tax=Pseudomonas nicosulfuronedens TaxID=2571105 RepID=A0A5R9R3W1_9PSED|nr:ferric reductase-like transmembrane domain-containing protein [Pseudomonas nicosulfuronedens]MDH1010725.1 ferric reductase-like transmembrane domain-containing protein [Pseudomonas nicosulfuronedens]MDH1979023.1 ferric reductase-like transmembrane domain-containing protein [Pseudomonas nicosulfuronedens]MDH2025924.1 ferric reductase-like transmembrane domain-containing protein [Pseudomonas nicosulfuronedens]TLX77331.1 ferric reductase like transmembrane component [Pseudomonas nicosulfuronede
MPALIARLALGCLLPVAVLLGLGAMPGLGYAWDFANAAGLLGGCLLGLLFIIGGRPQPRPLYEGKFFLRLHRDLGFVAIALLLVHIVVLLVDEPLLIEDLLPSAPGYMLAGLASAVLMLVLAISSLSRVRPRWSSSAASFRRWHYGGSLLALLLMAVHVLGAGYYSGGVWKGVLLVALILVVAVWPRLPKPGNGISGRKRNTAQRATWFALAASIVIVGMSALYSLLANVELPL